MTSTARICWILHFVWAIGLVGCSFIDPGPSEKRPPDPGGDELDHRVERRMESPTLTPIHEQGGGSRRPTHECLERRECPHLPNTAGWCNSNGECEYTCESGFADANGEVEADGCECKVLREGKDVCDGRDSDCDGVIDNPYAGGEVAAGDSHTCASDADGDIECWGPRWAAAAFELNLWAIEAGHRHSCGLDESGSAYCWGEEKYGKLGGQAEHDQVPVRVESSRAYRKLAAGRDHSCALTRDGDIECWGRNDYGQLGDGTLDTRSEPKGVSASVEFVDLTAGHFHTCGVSARGEILCWGYNMRGQLGLADKVSVNVPARIESPGFFEAVTAGANYSCGLNSGGLVYCWGDNEYGQLGDGTNQMRSKPAPIADELTFSTVSGGERHVCGLTDTGRLYCWGSAESKRLGRDDKRLDNRRAAPAVGEHRFQSVDAGGGHTCGLTDRGRLYCWGLGDDGQLGQTIDSTSSGPLRAGCPQP